MPKEYDFPRDLTGYSPVETLACGSASLVFKARQNSTGQLVTVKLHTPVESSWTAVRSFGNWPAFAVHAHPHLLSLIDAGRTAAGQLYTVSEFIPGETLRLYLQRHAPLEWRLAARLMVQLLDALASLHASGVVHLDLKPENVLVVNTGVSTNLKLIDFGAAVRLSDYPRRGVTSLTPGYCSAELLDGARPGPGADLYAWGLIFVECLTGKRPVVPCRDAHTGASAAGATASLVHASLAGHVLETLLRDVLHPCAADRLCDSRVVHARLLKVLDDRPQQIATDPQTIEAEAAARDPEVSPCSVLSVFCISLRLAALDCQVSDLEQLSRLQNDQQQDLHHAILAGGGRLIGTVGDRYFFRFVDLDAAPFWWRAVAQMRLLRDAIMRRIRTFQIEKGLLLDLCVGFHVEDVLNTDGSDAVNRAVNAAMRMNRLANPGAIMASAETARKLEDLVGPVGLEGLVVESV